MTDGQIIFIFVFGFILLLFVCCRICCEEENEAAYSGKNSQKHFSVILIRFA